MKGKKKKISGCLQIGSGSAEQTDERKHCGINKETLNFQNEYKGDEYYFIGEEYTFSSNIESQTHLSETKKQLLVKLNKTKENVDRDLLSIFRRVYR